MRAWDKLQASISESTILESYPDSGYFERVGVQISPILMWLDFKDYIKFNN